MPMYAVLMLSFQPGKGHTKRLDQMQQGSRKRESKFISNPSDKEKEEVTFAQGFLSDRHSVNRMPSSKDTTATAVTIRQNRGEQQTKGFDPLSKLQITVCTSAIFITHVSY